MNLHYGCGLDAGSGWFNCDASPTLRLQRLPLLGLLFKQWLKPRFPDALCYGDIVRGMNVPPNSCDAIYCSHILEHLSLEDCRVALRHTHSYLKQEGMFRFVVPDFGRYVSDYLADPQPSAVHDFMTRSYLGRNSTPRNLMGVLHELLGNSHHLWMWDEKGMAAELQAAGFVRIRRCQAGDSADKAFLAVENPDRFEGGLAFECSK